ncbi:MAG TPA: aldo/keto reductase, partial [Stellaceae bacterium]|nr:aldo/keto reductase [Stellaceae bacterium]
ARGITFFDTGPSYAAGNAERRLGAVLRHHRRTPGLVIATKVGTHVSPSGRRYKDWSPGAVRDSLARSLERLGLERVGLLHLHGPTIADLTPALLETLEALRRAGMVHFVGINSFDEAVVRAGLRIPTMDSFMVEYNVMKKRNAALIADIAAAGRAVLAGTPIAQALFTGQFLPPTAPRHLWALARALRNHRGEFAAAWRYRFLNRLPGIGGAQAALAYALANPQIATAIFNTTQLSHLEENVAAAGLTLPPEILAGIEAAADAPPA